MKSTARQDAPAANEPGPGATNVVPFPAGHVPVGAAFHSDDEQLALAFALQRETIQNLECTLACLAQVGGGANHQRAYRLIEETLADLKAITPGSVSATKDLAGLYSQLENCNLSLQLCQKLMNCNPTPRP